MGLQSFRKHRNLLKCLLAASGTSFVYTAVVPHDKL